MLTAKVPMAHLKGSATVPGFREALSKGHACFKLAGTGAVWNAGAIRCHQICSDSKLARSFVRMKEKGSIFWAQHAGLLHQHLQRTHVQGLPGGWGWGGVAAMISFNFPRKHVRLAVLTSFYSQRV